MKWKADGYDAFYSTLQAKRENREIKRLLKDHLAGVSHVVDLGCGTGLGQDLVPAHVNYLGTDIDREMIDYCCSKRRAKRGSAFMECDAKDALRLADGPAMALFSLTDFSWAAIRMFAKRDHAFAVVYDRPYLPGSASAFCAKRLQFIYKYGMKTVFMKLLLKCNGFTIFNLLDEPYYFVAMKRGGKVMDASVVGNRGGHGERGE